MMIIRLLYIDTWIQTDSLLGWMFCQEVNASKIIRNPNQYQLGIIPFVWLLLVQRKGGPYSNRMSLCSHLCFTEHNLFMAFLIFQLFPHTGIILGKHVNPSWILDFHGSVKTHVDKQMKSLKIIIIVACTV